MYPVPGKKIWPKNEALTVSAANPKSRSREKTSKKIKVNLHSKGERRYPFTDVLIIDGYKKPVQIRLKTNPVIDRFCKIYNDTISTTRLAGGLLCAYKARVTGQALKGPLNERSPSAPLSLAQALARAFVICCPCLLAHP